MCRAWLRHQLIPSGLGNYAASKCWSNIKTQVSPRSLRPICSTADQTVGNKGKGTILTRQNGNEHPDLKSLGFLPVLGKRSWGARPYPALCNGLSVCVINEVWPPSHSLGIFIWILVWKYKEGREKSFWGLWFTGDGALLCQCREGQGHAIYPCSSVSIPSRTPPLSSHGCDAGPPSGFFGLVSPRPLLACPLLGHRHCAVLTPLTRMKSTVIILSLGFYSRTHLLPIELM